MSALSGLQRVEAMQHNLDVTQQARLKRAFRMVSKEPRLRIAEQINFFACRPTLTPHPPRPPSPPIGLPPALSSDLNREMSAEELKQIGLKVHPPLRPGHPASWRDLLKLYAHLAVHPATTLLWDMRRQGREYVSEAALLRFWDDCQLVKVSALVVPNPKPSP